MTRLVRRDCVLWCLHFNRIALSAILSLTLIANGAPGTHSATSAIPTAQKGDLTLEIRVDGADNDLTTPVMEGQYSDVIKIIFGPQP